MSLVSTRRLRNWPRSCRKAAYLQGRQPECGLLQRIRLRDARHTPGTVYADLCDCADCRLECAPARRACQYGKNHPSRLCVDYGRTPVTVWFRMSRVVKKIPGEIPGDFLTVTVPYRYSELITWIAEEPCIFRSFPPAPCESRSPAPGRFPYTGSGLRFRLWTDGGRSLHWSFHSSACPGPH